VRAALAFVALLAAGCAGSGGAGRARCDPDPRPGSVCVVAGASYAADGLYRRFFGAGWRELWTTPALVPVLDLGATAGGLAPVKVVGRLQSLNLAMVGADGRAYTFRSTDKDNARAAHAPWKYLPFVERAYHDQTAAMHPGAPVIAGAIARAAGVLESEPRLVVMPDDPRLGEFRAAFAERLGTFEEYPKSGEGSSPGTFGALDIVDSEELFARLDRDPEERVDANAYLRARLVDFVIGDVDRHPGNWRWARLAARGPWLPVAEDRDLAFARFGGILIGVAKPVYPMLGHYDVAYEITNLAHQARSLDTRLLAPLSRDAWQDAVAAVQATLPRTVLEEAVRRLPAAWYATGGPALEALLAQRVAELGVAADALYARLAESPEIHASAAAEEVEIVADGDDAVRIRVGAAGSRALRFARRFAGAETHSVRLCGFAPPDRVTQGALAGSDAPAVELRDVCEPERALGDSEAAALGSGPDSEDAGDDDEDD
jgi:hypothetical protein